MRLLGKKFIPGFRIETNDEEEDDEQLIPHIVNGGIHIDQVERGDLEAQQTVTNTEQLAVNEPTEQNVVSNDRYITNMINKSEIFGLNIMFIDDKYCQ